MRKIFRDERGSNAIEMAIALPVLVLFIWGIVQVGLVFQANAGMQHALGEAARAATICVPVGDGCDAPSDDSLRTRMADSKFGTYNGTLGALTIEDLDSGGVVYAKKLTLTYSQPTNFLLFAGPTINLSKTKTVYLAD